MNRERKSSLKPTLAILLATILLCAAGGAWGAGQDVPVAPEARLREMVQAYADYHARTPEQRAAAQPPSWNYPALSKKSAEAWRAALWSVWQEHVQQGRQALIGDKDDPMKTNKGAVRAMGFDEKGQPKEQTMLYALRQFGRKPEGGWPLYINLHSGGNNKALNDRSWQATFKQYPIKNGLYVCPRSVEDTAESWYDPSMYALLTRLTMEAIALWDVNPDRVYLMGYSMGGWGSFHLGPAMPDYWGALAATAGAGFTGPSGRSAPDNLRNLPMMIQIGEKDTAFNRHALSRIFAQTLQQLHQQDAGGYIVNYKEHRGAGHAVNDRDTPSWLAKHQRNPWPDKIVWQQIVPRLGTTVQQIDAMRQANPSYNAHFRPRSYWLRNETPNAFQRIEAVRKGNRIEITDSRYLDRITVLLDDRFVNLDQPVEIVAGSQTLGKAIVPRRVETLISTLTERGDPQLTFSAQATVAVPDRAAQADQTQPRTAEDYWVRASYRVSTGRFAEGLDDYMAAMDKDPKLAQAAVFQTMQNVAGKIKGGDAHRMLEIYRRWAAVETGNHMVFRLYAYRLMSVQDESQRDLKTAQAMAKRAVAMTQRQDPMNLQILARTYFLQGDMQKAIAMQKEGLTAFPEEVPGNMKELKKSMEEQLKGYKAAWRKQAP